MCTIDQNKLCIWFSICSTVIVNGLISLEIYEIGVCDFHYFLSLLRRIIYRVFSTLSNTLNPIVRYFFNQMGFNVLNVKYIHCLSWIIKFTVFFPSYLNANIHFIIKRFWILNLQGFLLSCCLYLKSNFIQYLQVYGSYVTITVNVAISLQSIQNR